MTKYTLICSTVLMLLCSCNSLTGLTSVKPNDNGNLIVPLTIGKDIIYGVFDTGSTGSCLTGEEADEYDISCLEGLFKHLFQISRE